MTTGSLESPSSKHEEEVPPTKTDASLAVADGGRQKLYGRAFWESLGSPRFVLAPMVDQSEYAWRLLTRSFLTEDRQHSLLAYTPMIHARIFNQDSQSHSSYFDPVKQPNLSSDSANKSAPKTPGGPLSILDGNPRTDRPLFAQFCANDPAVLLRAAKQIQDHVDAVDLNLGCPQSIARKGHYGAFLQEDQDLIYRLVNTLHLGLKVPVTAKIRILETKEESLAYAQMLVRAGASIITVHGRRREQKGHNTGVADWSIIRHIRENIPHEVVMFANGNILRHQDALECLEVTKVDGVMSAEGNLCNPAIFTTLPAVTDPSLHWIGRNGEGGWRMDAVLRRYLDIVYKDILGSEAPFRKSLFIPTVEALTTTDSFDDADPESSDEEPQKKKQRYDKKNKVKSLSLSSMQAHLFSLLRPLVSKHTHVRDKLARCRPGDMVAFEGVLKGVERAVKEGLTEYAKAPESFEGLSLERQMMTRKKNVQTSSDANIASHLPEHSSVETARKVRLPWWVCQPRVRPLPAEALALGSLQMSKKEKAKLQAAED